MLQRIVIIIIVGLFASCCRNGGDIGFLWGTWKLESIEINGERDLQYQQNCFWKFQQNVICIEAVNDESHERTDHFGTWELIDNGSKLVLYFNHKDDGTPESTGVYSPPSDIYINQKITMLELNRLKGDAFIANYLDSAGTLFVYLLIKY